MKKLVFSTIVILLISACAPRTLETPEPRISPTIEPTSTPTAIPTETTTTTPTPTETPTPTVKPTKVRTPTPEVIHETVRYFTEDDFSIGGRMFGDGEIAVILTHMGEEGSNSLSSWVPFARHVAAGNKVTALAIDLRGYGSSVGDRSFSKQYLDILGAVSFLQERGYDRIVCIGASMGGNACVEAALAYPEFIGLAVIASNPSLERDYSILGMPKLFILEEGDPYGLTERMETVYEMMPGPKEYHTFPEDVHGTRMFKTPSGDEFRALLVNFLESFAN